MLQRGALYGLLLISLALSNSPAQEVPGVGDLFAFAAPRHLDPVIGPTDFRFAIADSARIDRIDVYVRGRLVGTATAPDWAFVWDAPSGLVDESIVAVAFGEQRLLEKLEISTSSAAFGELLQVVTVQLFPVVTDRRGRYVADLTQGDFSVYDEGERVEIESFSTEASSLSLALMIDKSRSMEGKIGTVQEASCQFVERLRPDDRVALYSFNQAVQRNQGLDADRDAVKESIRRLSPVGGTALYDALMQVMHDLAPIRGRKAIVIFSDGQDERSITSLARVVERARESEVIVYAVGTGESPEDLVAREDLDLLAEETGGQAHFIDRIRRLSSIFDSILDDLRAQYSLSFTPRPGPPGQRRVAVRTKDARYIVRCRRSYYHPGTGPTLDIETD